ncbi:MAG: hydroxyacylglutathione hydrolase [Saezia sp.]
MTIIALPAFSDNYIWMLHNGQEAIVIDPGIAAPVIHALNQHQLELAAILITHHHADHTGGIQELRPYLKGANSKNIFYPAKENIPGAFHPLSSTTPLHLLGLDIQVLDVPGHTAGHIAYYIPSHTLAEGEVFESSLFCGDTLFSGGCGRLFEGTAAQMLASLDQLAALPPDTKVYSAHEYTLSNLRFAMAVEPDNAAIKNYTVQCEAKRAQNSPTLPSTIKQELEINPFLRSRKPSVIKSVQFATPTAKDDISIFAALRSWKDNFK